MKAYPVTAAEWRQGRIELMNGARAPYIHAGDREWYVSTARAWNRQLLLAIKRERFNAECARCAP